MNNNESYALSYMVNLLSFDTLRILDLMTQTLGLHIPHPIFNWECSGYFNGIIEFFIQKKTQRSEHTKLSVKFQFIETSRRNQILSEHKNESFHSLI